ncbi:MAG TPA: HIT domain-containing protein [Anaerolineales bacterium]|nr:HIT domain-containing protein [Anaerolineales bacterium]
MKMLYRLVNTSFGRFLTGWMLAHMSFAIPVKRLRETDTLLAFRHPQPAHPFHVVILPKQAIGSFAELDPADPFLAELVRLVQGLVAEYHLPAYRLIVNGGAYQEFPRLHFHLISDASTPLPLSPNPLSPTP